MLKNFDNSLIFTSTKEACLAACLNEVRGKIGLIKTKPGLHHTHMCTITQPLPTYLIIHLVTHPISLWQVNLSGFCHVSWSSFFFEYRINSRPSWLYIPVLFTALKLCIQQQCDQLRWNSCELLQYFTGTCARAVERGVYRCWRCLLASVAVLCFLKFKTSVRTKTSQSVVHMTLTRTDLIDVHYYNTTATHSFTDSRSTDLQEWDKLLVWEILVAVYF